MEKTLKLGRRIELFSMDRHCRSISLGLYCREIGSTPQVLVHTYSSVEGASERAQFITGALIVMAGLERVPDAPDWLRFPCKSFHQRALKRAFLDLCKLESNATLEAKPLAAFDKKAGCHLAVVNRGRGVYQIEHEQETAAAGKRAAALAFGFVRLCEMQAAEETANRVSFRCEAAHDELMGMLMFRAQNVRAAMREEELTGSRGVLAAPSQQN